MVAYSVKLADGRSMTCITPYSKKELMRELIELHRFTILSIEKMVPKDLRSSH